MILKFKKDKQCNKIFRTCGTINDKACNVIIDSSSSKNIVFKALVDVMRLSMKKHPAPYRIGWIKKRTKTGVIEMCHVPFSIEKIYKSNVGSDIVYIDACHLLLGRFWQFNMNAVHRGRDNVY